MSPLLENLTRVPLGVLAGEFLAQCGYSPMRDLTRGFGNDANGELALIYRMLEMSISNDAIDKLNFDAATKLLSKFNIKVETHIVMDNAASLIVSRKRKDGKQFMWMMSRTVGLEADTYEAVLEKHKFVDGMPSTEAIESYKITQKRDVAGIHN